jgi:hypothetical protein
LQGKKELSQAQTKFNTWQILSKYSWSFFSVKGTKQESFQVGN